ncbi:MAG: preprotein translocase subunit SecD [Parcubacteria group bacterium Greene0714_21]|nr:MAG: preprotein translocase subunit SecD [Parcubacteria group bacterium Greene0416_39]TSC97830.1 MAG: preprotein translocase subunit SecD [Parcubacteria group bacterium Greene1014_47]TSD04577.1 MAG: preprotein translocase subunit SecD [Parcubacteria group bacterium Greene0714_21]
MRKGRTFLTVGIILIAGIAAGFFDMPQYANSLAKKLPFSLPSIPDKSFQLGLDLQGGIHLVYEADLSQITSADYDSAMQGLRDVIERRVNLFGVKEPLVQTEGKREKRRLIVELAGMQDPSQAIALIGQTPYLEFRETKPDYSQIIEKNQELFKEGKTDFTDPYASTALTGRYLKKAELGFDSLSQEPLVLLQFDDEGAKIFEELTQKNLGKPVAIFLDGQLLQAPTVQGVIAGGRAQITGKFTIEEAKTIVRNLNAGALPIPITLISQQSIGATLGHDSLAKSLKAGIGGFIAVIVFMALWYRLPGLLASLALVLYVVLLLAIFKFISLTFTLAGIAGFILSIGMAVDANVLVFSRMREELKEGRSLSGALAEGFKRAWPSIWDGNVTAMLVALILFWFGSSFVQGFAFTLLLGTITSMFTALFITRNFLRVFEGTFLQKFKWLW